MPYRNNCKKCNHTWVTPTEGGAATKCPNCGAASSTLVGSAFFEDTFFEGIPGPEAAATTEFDLTGKAEAKVEKSPDLDVKHNGD